MPGMGGEVRTYHFIKTAAQCGNVTLIFLGLPGAGGFVQSDIADLCWKVIQPSLAQEPANGEIRKPKSRLSSWFSLFTTCLFPWRRRWTRFLDLCTQHVLPAPDESSQPIKWTRRLLSRFLNRELTICCHLLNVPPLCVYMFDKSFQAIEGRLQAELSETVYDALWIENTLSYPFSNEVVRRLGASIPKVICNAHNVETLVINRIAEQSSTPGLKQFWQLQAMLMQRLEQAAYSQSQLIFQCSHPDVEAAKKICPTGNYEVIGNGVDVDYFKSRNATGSQRPTVVFTAGFGYGPNRDGLMFFVTRIWPLILQQIPNCRFLFAGSQAGEMLKLLGEHSGSIECICTPKDMRPVFEEAWVFIVPLLTGGGTRLKILEAMAMERPIVSTSMGAEGLPCINGHHLLLADSPAEFAAQVVRLISDKELRKQLAQQGREWVTENYTWKSLCEQAASTVDSFLAVIDNHSAESKHQSDTTTILAR